MKKQRGWSELEIIGVGLTLTLLVVLGVTCVHVYNRAITEAVTAKRDMKTAQDAAQDQRVENVKLTAEKAALDKQVTERKVADIKKADIERMIANGLQNLYSKSPENRKWADTPVPADVLAWVRNSGAGASNDNGKGSSPNPVDKSNPGGAVAAPNDKRGPTRLLSPFDKQSK